MTLKEQYFSQERRLALIDADSIIYIIGWRNRDLYDTAASRLKVEKDLDDFMVGIIQITHATHYLGTFSDSKTFRNEIATSRPYKGTRGVAPDWIVRWKPVIKSICTVKYGFMNPENVEADDVLSVMRDDNVVYCSPDKDLAQIPGLHYDYSKDEWYESTIEEANYRYWKQVLMGDSTDNIPGLPKMGPVGAEKLLNAHDRMWWMKVVEDKYKQVMGENWFNYYAEQLSLVTLLKPCESLVRQYSKFIQEVEYTKDESLAEQAEELNNEYDGLLQADQRLQLGDILSVTSDLSQ